MRDEQGVMMLDIAELSRLSKGVLTRMYHFRLCR